MEYLVTLTHKIALAWKEALGDGEGKEESGQQKAGNMESVEGQRRLLGPRDGEQAMDYRADV